MPIYARIENGVAVELIDTGDYAINQLYAPAFVESMVRVPDGVQVELGAPVSEFEKAIAPLAVVQIPALLQTPVSADQAPVDGERTWRLSALSASEWLVARHRDEQDLGRGTSLGASQYLQLLEYRQALRDWPDSGVFPVLSARPSTPDWLDSVSGVK